MFSTEDVRELIQTFSPPRSRVGALPSLVYASSGEGLVTLQAVHKEFEHRVTKGKHHTGRLSYFANVGQKTTESRCQI